MSEVPVPFQELKARFQEINFWCSNFRSAADSKAFFCEGGVLINRDIYGQPFGVVFEPSCSFRFAMAAMLIQ